MDAEVQSYEMLPDTEDSFLIRTDFSNDRIWEEIKEAACRLYGEFKAYLHVVDDRRYEGLSAAQLGLLVPTGQEHTFLIVADHQTMVHPERPVLVVELADEPGREFRALPRTIQSIDNNLSISNMDFEEFAERVGPDGVFRGFDDA